MDSHPKTVNGIRVNNLLRIFLAILPDIAGEKLKRVFIFLAPKIINPDSFCCALYGLEALDESPLSLTQNLTTALLRVHHAIEISCDRKKVEELIVALEWSENGKILAEILEWTEKLFASTEPPKKNTKFVVQQALRNQAVLHRIFSHLSNRCLLLYCSLVNKAWNTESRTFVRDHRKCQPGGLHGPFAPKSPCKYLLELHRLTENIKENGRVIPWNSLKVDQMFSRSYCSQASAASEKKTFETVLLDNLKLTHIEIGWMGDSQCPVHMPFLNLLHRKASQIQTMWIQNLPMTVPKGLQGWKPYFPELKEVTIIPWLGDPAAKQAIARKMLQGAPNVRKIVTMDFKALQAVPDDKHGLLNWLNFCYLEEKYERMYRSIALKGPPVETLIIEGNLAHPYACGREGDENNVATGMKLREKLDPHLEVILQRCCHSVKEIRVEGWNPLSQLSFPPLIHLSELWIEKPYGASLDGFWKSIASIDYTNCMPNLQKVQLTVQTINTSGCFGDSHEEGNVDIEWPGQYEEGNVDIEWPGQHEETFHFQSGSNRELTLNLQVGRINMNRIASVFPNVSSLFVEVQNGRKVQSDIVPSFSAIWEAWPQLAVLRVIGEQNHLRRNCDAEFCGIFDEEAELLREMDTEYLKAVHIVPIRPSALTMPCLTTLLIELEFNNVAGRLKFISQVTEFVVLQRRSENLWNKAISGKCVGRSYDQ